MRRRPNLLVLAVSLGLWLAAGPSGTTIGAIVGCEQVHHSAGAPSHHHEHTLPAPDPTTPCFCGQMTVGNDVLLAFAVPVPEIVPVGPMMPPVDLVFASPATPHPSFVTAPPAPPPNSLLV